LKDLRPLLIEEPNAASPKNKEKISHQTPHLQNMKEEGVSLSSPPPRKNHHFIIDSTCFATSDMMFFSELCMDGLPLEGLLTFSRGWLITGAWGLHLCGDIVWKKQKVFQMHWGINRFDGKCEPGPGIFQGIHRQLMIHVGVALTAKALVMNSGPRLRDPHVKGIDNFVAHLITSLFKQLHTLFVV